MLFPAVEVRSKRRDRRRGATGDVAEIDAVRPGARQCVGHGGFPSSSVNRTLVAWTFRGHSLKRSDHGTRAKRPHPGSFIGAGCGNRTHDLMITRAAWTVRLVLYRVVARALSWGFAVRPSDWCWLVSSRCGQFVGNPWARSDTDASPRAASPTGVQPPRDPREGAAFSLTDGGGVRDRAQPRRVVVAAVPDSVAARAELRRAEGARDLATYEQGVLPPRR